MPNMATKRLRDMLSVVYTQKVTFGLRPCSPRVRLQNHKESVAFLWTRTRCKLQDSFVSRIILRYLTGLEKEAKNPVSFLLVVKRTSWVFEGLILKPFLVHHVCINPRVLCMSSLDTSPVTTTARFHRYPFSFKFRQQNAHN